MLTRDQAFHNLHLSPEATPEEIEQSYRRMVRRYPPEYHPDRFRLIDESYRTLTSLAFVVENIFLEKNQENSGDLIRQVLALPLGVDEQAVTQGMEGLRRVLLCATMWP